MIFYCSGKVLRRLRLRPRCLRGVSQLDIGCEIFGEKMKWPLGIAPTAMQKRAHPDDELGNARAAGQAGSIFILSNLSNTSLEDLAAGEPDTFKWFQLYIYKDLMITEKMIHRCEGRRRGPTITGTSGINEYVAGQLDRTITWKDIQWLKKVTRLPIVVKGILTAEDAVLAKEFGCTGIIVSKQGARQLYTVPASIEALLEVVKAVGHDLVVMLDGGIMQGIDIFKALALGAKTVFVVCVVFLGCIFVSVAYVPRPIFGDASALMKGIRCWRSVLHYMRELGM
ncbi:GL10464 [Drosophila persimilis]|uniref:GL10464 n=1 Tax=Drosophila persimilis TaxID=7234 RepID=B4GC24_DROPE|nr:GL10464 [Drosophila persimilis]